ncbi:MAG: hypothetical protein AAFQ68_21590 [Bacteroidota bacterium]
MNLQDLQAEWKEPQAQEEDVLEKDWLSRKSRFGFREQMAAFNRDHGPTAVLAQAIVFSVLGILSILAWAFKAQDMMLVTGFSFTSLSHFLFARYAYIRRATVQDVDMHTFLENNLRRLQWHRLSVILSVVLGTIPIGVYGLVHASAHWQDWGRNEIIAFASALIIAGGILSGVHWYQKRFMYDHVQLRQEIKSLLSEYSIKQA